MSKAKIAGGLVGAAVGIAGLAFGVPAVGAVAGKATEDLVSGAQDLWSRCFGKSGAAGQASNAGVTVASNPTNPSSPSLPSLLIDDPFNSEYLKKLTWVYHNSMQLLMAALLQGIEYQRLLQDNEALKAFMQNIISQIEALQKTSADGDVHLGESQKATSARAEQDKAAVRAKFSQVAPMAMNPTAHPTAQFGGSAASTSAASGPSPALQPTTSNQGTFSREARGILDSAIARYGDGGLSSESLDNCRTPPAIESPADNGHAPAGAGATPSASINADDGANVEQEVHEVLGG